MGCVQWKYEAHKTGGRVCDGLNELQVSSDSSLQLSTRRYLMGTCNMFSQLDVCAGTWTSVQPLSILFQNAVACSKLVFLGFLLTDMHETAVAYWTRCKGHSAVIPVSTPSLRALYSVSLAF